MTTKERLHELVDELSELEADDALRMLIARLNTLQANGASSESDEEIDEPVVVGLPESWKTFEDGTPQPNWTALIRADRDSGH